VISKENIKKSDYVISIILLAGIILSGSRTVFVLMLVANIVMALIISKKRNRFYGFFIFSRFSVAPQKNMMYNYVVDKRC
jgi:hypothetical protein